MPDLLDPIDHTSDKVHAGEANIVADLISLVEEAPRASIETFAFEGREKYMNRTILAVGLGFLSAARTSTSKADSLPDTRGIQYCERRVFIRQSRIMQYVQVCPSACP
eukprot:CAMPEP_0169185626 /NCGR_PEP_ID=MMETSP1016-20121227/1906_1 /TAXON_ID=342587 /ORGANISM="Karlodinium micrum, Strain CCMP2283" /LENGTH=107 /DNA_ID=CAMNT_0009261361 /DNA_START=239 /DNA_END=562 /DNA_ORIENTATION=-